MDSIPVIRLTLEGMKASIVQAFNQHVVDLDENIRIAVEEYCKPENVKRVVDAEVSRAIEAAIRDEVERFYRIGGGRVVIAETVRRTLKP